jgi:hypothetical protein
MNYSKEELKLLDEFAKAALQSCLRHESTHLNNTSEAVAFWSYQYAAAMIDARKGFVE